jgi:hypothetical protein
MYISGLSPENDVSSEVRGRSWPIFFPECVEKYSASPSLIQRGQRGVREYTTAWEYSWKQPFRILCTIGGELNES